MTLSCVRFPITAANGITRRGTCFRTATFYSTIFVLWTHLVVFTIRKYTRSYNEDRKRFFTIRYQSFKYLSLPLSFSTSPPLPLSPSPPLPLSPSLSLSLSLSLLKQSTYCMILISLHILVFLSCKHLHEANTCSYNPVCYFHRPVHSL